MNAATTAKRQILKARRSAGKKRCLSTYVAKATENQAARKAVTAALRKAAKPLREAGALGRVQARTCYVAAGVVGRKYRYTEAQLRRACEAYKPRKAEYKAVKAALMGV